MTVHVTIRYVDGTIRECAAEEWWAQRADGVDRVVVRNQSGPSTMHGRSAYWLYQDGDVWVAGCASFGYDATLPPEVLFQPDGRQDTRSIEYVPDLRHTDIKLGWWWPGTQGRPT